MSQKKFMREAIKLAEAGMRGGRGGPFGCVVVRKGEVVAIREACAHLETFQLDDCELYTSCEPCPMCLSAIYWARIPKVFFGNTRADAAAIGFDDDFIYQQVPLPPAKRAIAMKPLLRDEALKSFREWTAKSDKVRY